MQHKDYQILNARINIKEDLTNLSDTKLVELFLKEKDKETQQALRDTIFARFYEHFDRTIRTVLRIKGISYQVNEEYYNSIFAEVYMRIFSLHSFDKKLRNFDLNKNFQWWFFAVMRREVYDWLKKVDPATRLSNYEILKNIAETKAKESSMDKPGNEQYQWESPEITCTEEDTKNKQLRSLIDSLPDSQRVLLRLEFIAYENLCPNDIEYIAKETVRSTDEVQAEINELRTSLRESDQFKNNQNIELQLASLKLKEENLERKLSFARAKLQVLGCNNFKEIEKDVENSTLKRITEKIKVTRDQLRHKSKKKGSEAEAIRACYLEFETIHYMKVLKHLQIIRKKRKKILRDYKSGKYFIRPNYKQMAAILGIEEGTIGSRKNRAKEALLRGIVALRKK